MVSKLVMADHEASPGPSGKAPARRWLPYRREKPGACLRLFLFHWAGASASAYASWERLASSDVEVCSVQMPGREGFEFDGDQEGLEGLARAFVDEVGDLFRDGVGSVFFAHGTGTWLAFEVIRLLESADATLGDAEADQHGGSWSPPSAFYVSNFPAPDIPLDERPWPAISYLKDSEATRALCQTWRVPVAALRPPALQPMLAALRSDFGLIDGHLRGPQDEEDGRAVRCPIRIFVSRDDPFVGPRRGQPALMDAWGRFTSAGQVEVDVFYGDHYYLVDRKMGEEVGRILMDRVQALADLLSFEL